jgi:3,4-dihydroxy 2-butanone 4-phosphate synthase/GTP cyclohydrolase II
MVPYSAWLAQAAAFRAEFGRPLVTLSYAQSLDGSLTARRGQPLALSGAASAALTHSLRSAHAAILVGIGTVLADDPSLTVRHVPGPSPQPVVLDSRLRFPLQARLLRHPRGVWVACSGADPQKRLALQSAGARLLDLPPDEAGRVSLPALLACLADEGIDSLMVEGGARVIRAFLSQGLADTLVLTIAPLFVGGLHAIEGLLPDFPRLEEAGYERLGEDLIVWGRIK